jgi:hypothetical protein
VAEATDLVDLSKWPTGTRLILRKERPHTGAQLSFTDSDGHRITGFLTDTADAVIPGQLAGLELRHRQHARVEDRIRQAKVTGLRNLPFHSFDANAAWLEIIMAATDLIAWAKLIGLHRPSRPSPLRDRHLPLPGSPRGRPYHPRRPTTAATHRRHLALGTGHRHRMDPNPHRLHLTAKPRPDETKGPVGLRKARPTGATPGTLSYPPTTINSTSQLAPAHPRPARPREKSKVENLPIAATIGGSHVGESSNGLRESPVLHPVYVCWAGRARCSGDRSNDDKIPGPSGGFLLICCDFAVKLWHYGWLGRLVVAADAGTSCEI